jgi:hypothetical protein
MNGPVTFQHPDAKAGTEIIRAIMDNTPAQQFLERIPGILEDLGIQQAKFADQLKQHRENKKLPMREIRAMASVAVVLKTVTDAVDKLKTHFENYERHKVAWDALVLKPEERGLVERFGLQNLSLVKPGADQLLFDTYMLLEFVKGSEIFSPWDRNKAEEASTYLQRDILSVEKAFEADNAVSPVAALEQLLPQALPVEPQHVGEETRAAAAELTRTEEPEAKLEPSKPETTAFVRVDTGAAAAELTQTESAPPKSGESGVGNGTAEPGDAAVAVAKPQRKFGVVDGSGAPAHSGSPVAMGRFRPDHIDATRGRQAAAWGVIEGDRPTPP